MRICYIGDFDPTYNRNSVILQGLRDEDVDVLVVSIRERSMLRFAKILLEYYRSGRSQDITIVGYSDTSRWVMIMLKVFGFVSNPVVWDAFYSTYDAYVNDKGLIGEGTLKAKYHYFIDRFALRAADRILLDTNEHIRYFVETFRVPREKFVRVLVGANLVGYSSEETKEKSEQNFLVHFHGHYIPLQGVISIIEAAKYLESEPGVSFRMIGKGQMYKVAREKAETLDVQNIEFIDNVPYRDLIMYLKEADISLGIFGGTDKAKRVIPNKVYEAISLGIPVVTADTPAIREIFTDRQNILLCRSADPLDLAQKIMELKNDNVFCARLGEGGKKLFYDMVTPQKIVRTLLDDLADLDGK